VGVRNSIRNGRSLLPFHRLYEAMSQLWSFIMSSAPTIEDKVCCREQVEIDRMESIVQRRLNGRVRNFRLRAFPGGLILQGSAATYHVKQLVQHAIMELSELPILANEIEVDVVALAIVVER
jgi:hypothetical protein